jgi:hypothetical protein
VRTVTVAEDERTAFGDRSVTLKLRLGRTGRRLIKRRTKMNFLLDIDVSDRKGNRRRQRVVVRLSD